MRGTRLDIMSKTLRPQRENYLKEVTTRMDFDVEGNHGTQMRKKGYSSHQTHAFISFVLFWWDISAMHETKANAMLPSECAPKAKR